MSVTTRWSGALALLLVGGLAHAQGTGAAMRPQIAPFPAAPNMAVLGGASQVAPGLYGPAAAAPAGIAAFSPAVPAVNPYALSTVPSYNPYLASTAAMSAYPAASPYSLSTTPGYYPPYPYYPQYYGPEGGMLAGYGQALMGFATTVNAAGKYAKDIQTARIIREQSRQAALDTQRRAIEFQLWYEGVRPTAPKMLAAERATDLERARSDASDAEVNSGRALNILLESIRKTGSLNRGPNVGLEEDTLKHLNLTGGTSAGSVGLLKDGVKLAWPEGLMSEGFEEARKRLTRNLRSAVEALKDRDPVDATTLKDIRADYKTIREKLDESVNDLSFEESIRATRFLKQLDQAIRALSDPQVHKYFNNTWNAKGKTVAELVAHMTKEGLNFAPAAPGDEAAYRAAYLALRAFEHGLQLASRN